MRVLQYMPLHFSGPLLMLYNISQHFSISLHHLQLHILRFLNFLLRNSSLFGFPMTSALSVILEEEQKVKKFENRLSQKQKKTFPTYTLLHFLHFQSSSTLRILQLFSLSFFFFFFFCFHSSSAPGTRKDLA